jgi:hypothetical protein
MIVNTVNLVSGVDQLLGAFLVDPFLFWAVKP